MRKEQARTRLGKEPGRTREKEHKTGAGSIMETRAAGEARNGTLTDAGMETTREMWGGGMKRAEDFNKRKSRSRFVVSDQKFS